MDTPKKSKPKHEEPIAQNHSSDSLMQAAFNPLLPWHQTIWQRLTQQYPAIGHALLFSG